MLGGFHDEVSFDATNPVGRPVRGEDLVAVQTRVENRQLHVVPIFLVERSIELQVLIEPRGFPADFLVLERIRGIEERDLEFTVQRRIRRNDALAAIESAGSEAL